MVISASIAPTKSKGTFFPAESPKVQRPRTTSVTHLLDRLQHVTAEEISDLASYIDIAKIGWGLPLLLPKERLKARVHLYQKEGIEVSTGGTLLEYAVAQNRVPAFLDEARVIGFDLIEISSGILELSATQIARLADAVRDRGLPYLIEVGKKDPQHQLSLKETINQIGHARTLGPRKVIVESRESGRGVGIYDSDGAIKWDWVRSILAEHPREELIFEAPLESQQIQLLRELGGDVNLGNVALASVAPLASERMGLRGETFGTIRTSRPVKGPPAAKFLYFLLESYRGLDQSQLAQMSRLPRRTVQSALESLRQQGLVQESISLQDSRRREYRLT
ncbi:MAG TPA: phosphosulfolactate synthase [Thermoplasmata archaeon]|nr:phosphosulfolactate synthase [Thermoplasmata archaeon]